MATVNEQLAHEAIDHSIDLTRYSNSVIRRVIALLNRADRDLANQITAALERLPAESFTVERLDALLQSVRQTNAVAYQQVTQLIETELKDLVQYEAAYQYQLFQSTLPVQVSVASVSVGQVYAAALARPFQGTLLREALAGLEANKARMVRDAIRIGYVEGQTIQQITQRIMGTRALQYTDGLMETSRRDAAAMVRTAVSHTANFTRNEFYKQNNDLVKGIKWISTIDGKTSAVCRARDGEIYPVDSGPRPPAHWNCLPGDSLITSCGTISGVSKRWIDADIFIINTSSGNELSCTPNHPILTNRGWVAAKLLNIGDKVVCGAFAEREGLREWDDNNVVPTIHDVTESFLSSGEVFSIPMPVSAKDFHGDGADSDVAVVWSNSFLCNRGKSAGLEAGKESVFINGCSDTFSLLSSGSHEAQFLHASNAASNCMVGSRCKCLSFSGASDCHACELLFRPVSCGDSITSEDSPDGMDACSGLLINSAHSYSRGEHVANNLVRNSGCIDGSLNCSIGLAQDDNTVLFEDPVSDVVRDSKLASDICNGKYGVVTFDDLVSVRKEKFSGHVYNLETENGFYSANGIVTHNCRSSTAPVIKSWKELVIDLPESAKSTRASMSGQVPDDMTYQDWLKKQPVERQDDILGKTKGQLFRKGGLTLERFVDRNGRELNLAELRAKNAAAFAKAGL